MNAAIHPFPDRFDKAGNRWEPWVSQAALAQHFGVDARTVRRWNVKGLPSQEFDGICRYRVSECESWLAARKAS